MDATYWANSTQWVYIRSSQPKSSSVLGVSSLHNYNGDKWRLIIPNEFTSINGSLSFLSRWQHHPGHSARSGGWQREPGKSQDEGSQYNLRSVHHCVEHSEHPSQSEMTYSLVSLRLNYFFNLAQINLVILISPSSNTLPNYSQGYLQGFTQVLWVRYFSALYSHIGEGYQSWAQTTLISNIQLQLTLQGNVLYHHRLSRSACSLCR